MLLLARGLLCKNILSKMAKLYKLDEIRHGLIDSDRLAHPGVAPARSDTDNVIHRKATHPELTGALPTLRKPANTTRRHSKHRNTLVYSGER